MPRARIVAESRTEKRSTRELPRSRYCRDATIALLLLRCFPADSPDGGTRPAISVKTNDRPTWTRRCRRPLRGEEVQFRFAQASA
jgi:hypothetical protein